MASFTTLFSGSSGNASYFASDSGGILIDIGRSCKQMCLSLALIGVDPSSIGAVFVTHEHTDHIAGLRVFCSRYHTPVYATSGTLDALDSAGVLKGDFDVYAVKGSTDICGMNIRDFRTMHDSRESCGYTVTFENGKKASYCTDLGVVTDEVYSAVRGSDIILAESNHDISMLRDGPYPYVLKQRILSDTGHLSNAACAKFSMSLLEDGTKSFVLGHLSAQNNMPDIAFGTTYRMFTESGAVQDRDFTLRVAPRDEPLGLTVI
jgi:phosphoribosyl 1,2-cyclic phosphodiesterase